ASRLDGGSSNRPDSPGDTTGFYGEDDARIERRSVDVRTDIRPTTNATLSIGAAVEREQARNNSSSQFQTFPNSSSTFGASNQRGVLRAARRRHKSRHVHGKRS